eukprot:3934904-Rhodomonas_salina.1
MISAADWRAAERNDLDGSQWIMILVHSGTGTTGMSGPGAMSSSSFKLPDGLRTLAAAAGPQERKDLTLHDAM